MTIGVCLTCGKVKPIKNKRFECNPCYEKRNGRSQINKGVGQHNLLVNYFLRLDRSRGLTYGQLAMRYKIDEHNIRKRVLGILNK